MLRFVDFLMEDKNYGLKPDPKGKLHEVLTAHYLMHGDHNHEPHERGVRDASTHFPMRPDSKHETDDSAARAEYHKHRDTVLAGENGHENWEYHKQAARSAASHIRNHLRSKGIIGANEKITNVHWTSRKKDIERISGEADAANKSDLVLETSPSATHVATVDKKKKSQRTESTKKYVGLSMKIHNARKESTLANPGTESMDRIFNVSTGHHHAAMADRAHATAAAHGIDTRSMTLANAHEALKNHPANDELKPHTRATVEKVAQDYHNSIKDLHPHDLADKLTQVANIQKTKMPTIFSATYGGRNNMSHHVDDPHEEMTRIIDTHRDHLKTELVGNTIKFKGKDGVPLGKLSVKYKSSTPFSSQPVGNLSGWSASAKASSK